MVRENSPGYGPMGALRVERVTKSDGRYVLYYSWPATPDPPAEPAAAGRSDSTSKATPGDGAPDTTDSQSPVAESATPDTERARSDRGV